jgi:hypothetical protein
MTARFSRWILALLVALVAAGISFGSAAAAPAGKPTPPKPNNAALARTYKLQQNRLKHQDVRLKNAEVYAGKIDQQVAKLKAKGQDTTALEQAVAAFRASIAQARAEWQQASAVLTTHAGFDDAGQVTNADQASATLKDAHSHMEQAHTIARTAYRSLHAAVVAYRKAHRQMAEPVAPPAP